MTNRSILKDSPPRYASLATAAEYAECGQKTIRRRISDGTITGYRMAGSRLIRVDLNEVDTMLRPIPAAGGGLDAA